MREDIEYTELDNAPVLIMNGEVFTLAIPKDGYCGPICEHCELHYLCWEDDKVPTYVGLCSSPKHEHDAFFVSTDKYDDTKVAVIAIDQSNDMVLNN